MVELNVITVMKLFFAVVITLALCIGASIVVTQIVMLAMKACFWVYGCLGERFLHKDKDVAFELYNLVYKNNTVEVIEVD